MPASGLAFLFDIVVENLKSFVPSKKFVIKSQFADIFSLVLKNPDKNERKQKRKKSSKNKAKAKKAKDTTDNSEGNKTSRKGQTILFVGNTDVLMSHMMQYPMEICLCSEYNPEERIGSTLIPWSSAFIEYMISLYHEARPAPAVVKSVYNIFDESTSKKMASIHLNVKLRITDQVKFNQYKSLSKKHPNTFILMDPDEIYIDQSTNTMFNEGTGTIKTIYSGGKQKRRISASKRNAKREANLAKPGEERDTIEISSKSIHTITRNKVDTPSTIDRKVLLHFTRSETSLPNPPKLDLLSSKSCTAIKQINLFKYIFGDRSGPFGNKTYTVGYVTVDNTKSPSGSSTSPPASSTSPPAIRSPDKISTKSKQSDQVLTTTTVKCDTVSCIYKKEKPPSGKPDDRILLTSVKQSCCVTEAVERKLEIIGTSLEEEKEPCYCACECKFGFERKTTYCRICKGYEKRAEDLDGIPQYLMPDPCPVYHKISRIKTGSTSGSDSKKESKKRVKSPEPKVTAAAEEEKKEAKKKNRFKFNYGYKGIPPQIGHSRCALPCTGTMSNVPKYMGWLWTADNVPGLMFRPSWKPGAINKVVGRKLRNALHPGEVVSKRKKAMGLKKRPLKRPLLVVHKKDGEFTVTMETMKSYIKPRTLNQPPYDDKPVLTYTIGRTEEENREIQRRKDRAARRLEREQRKFIQSAFTDMCKEICLKTYQQALQLLPDSEDPECTCFPAPPDPEEAKDDRSCSCSDDGQESLGSDTDDDEWILEFTPPNAYYDAAYPGTKVKTVDNETQYTYLDYRVKLLDRFGNPVPRFFKGPDGRQQCSDLGGFWSADHNWLQINVDGYIGPDGRWAPVTFIGPGGEQVDTNTGKFQDSKGNWLVVGVDGYVDCNNKWKYYRRPVNKKQQPAPKKKNAVTKSPKGVTVKKAKKAKKQESLPTFSCFGDATPVDLSRIGIVGHGPDKKLLNRMLRDLVDKGVKVKIPQTPRVPKSPASDRSRQRQRAARYASDSERSVCRHPKPSLKGVIKYPDGSQTYYRPHQYDNNRRLRQRIHDLDSQGRSLSTFHEPCFRSNTNIKKRRAGRRVVVTAPQATRI